MSVHDAEEIGQMFGGEGSSGDAAPEAVLLRVFVHFHGAKVILLIGGYDKGGDPSERRQQRRDPRGSPAPHPVQREAAAGAGPGEEGEGLTLYVEFPILVWR